jgi:hypothetical protein
MTNPLKWVFMSQKLQQKKLIIHKLQIIMWRERKVPEKSNNWKSSSSQIATDCIFTTT